MPILYTHIFPFLLLDLYHVILVNVKLNVESIIVVFKKVFVIAIILVVRVGCSTDQL